MTPSGTGSMRMSNHWRLPSAKTKSFSRYALARSTMHRCRVLNISVSSMPG